VIFVCYTAGAVSWQRTDTHTMAGAIALGKK